MLASTPIKPNYHSAAKLAIAKVDAPIQPAVLDNWTPPCYTRNSSGDGCRQLQSEL